MRMTLIACLLVPFCFLFVPSLAAAQEVQWRYDYNTARKEAEQKGLPLVLDFGTENCFYCKKLDETTFREPTVARTMNEQFVPLKIDANRDPELTRQLRVERYPTLVFAGPDGKILGTMEGYQPAERFSEYLQRALASVTNPDWMVRDYQEASRAVQKSDFARAVGLLKTVVEDGKGRPIQQKAAGMLQELEQQAAARLTAARRLQDGGKTGEAAEMVAVLVRDFAGTQT